MLAETMLADLWARAARVRWCKCTVCTTWASPFLGFFSWFLHFLVSWLLCWIPCFLVSLFVFVFGPPRALIVFQGCLLATACADSRKVARERCLGRPWGRSGITVLGTSVKVDCGLWDIAAHLWWCHSAWPHVDPFKTYSRHKGR